MIPISSPSLHRVERLKTSQETLSAVRILPELLDSLILPSLIQWEKPIKALYMREFMLDQPEREERYLSLLVNLKVAIKECESPHKEKLYIICSSLTHLHGFMVVTSPDTAGKLYSDTNFLVIENFVTTPDYPDPSWIKIAEQTQNIFHKMLKIALANIQINRADGLIIRSEPAWEPLFRQEGFQTYRDTPHLMTLTPPNFRS